MLSIAFGWETEMLASSSSSTVPGGVTSSGTVRRFFLSIFGKRPPFLSDTFSSILWVQSYAYVCEEDKDYRVDCILLLLFLQFLTPRLPTSREKREWRKGRNKTHFLWAAVLPPGRPSRRRGWGRCRWSAAQGLVASKITLKKTRLEKEQTSDNILRSGAAKTPLKKQNHRKSD